MSVSWRGLLPTDYIRTFTWDKKLEMVVKSTGILGGQGESGYCIHSYQLAENNMKGGFFSTKYWMLLKITSVYYDGVLGPHWENKPDFYELHF